MNKISFNTSQAFEVEIDKVVYYLRDPLTDEVQGVGKKMSEAEPEKATGIFEDFILSLGLPKDAWNKLGVMGRRHLADSLLEGLAGKK